MGLSPFENLLWLFGTALKVLLCILVFYRHIYRRLPFFCIYVALLVAKVGVVWSVYRAWGYTSRLAWYTGWCAVGVVLLARGLVVAELCWTSLRNYPGIWSFVSKVLVFLAVVVLVYAGTAAYQNKTPVAAFVLTADRGSEILVLVILVALLGFGLTYNVPLGSFEQNVILGIGMYSAFQVVNDSFMSHWMTRYFHWWNSTRVISFDIALIIWIVPLRKALPPPSNTPLLLPEEVAQQMLREILDRMREVADELKRVGKSIRK
jgi:hypothetical protein